MHYLANWDLRHEMTYKVFWDDPYLTELDTVVARVENAHVTLARTILFAESGGQESDHGSIGGHPVAQARRAGPDIVYTLAADHGLRPGEVVRLRIDWPRRYALMRLHFAAEVMLELAYRRFPGIVKIGAHIAQDKARIDFQWPENLASHFPALAAQADALVGADAPILSAFSDPAAGRRYWEVTGFARVPCGGTHLRRTGEVGAIALKRRNVGQGKERIEIRLADQKG